MHIVNDGHPHPRPLSHRVGEGRFTLHHRARKNAPMTYGQEAFRSVSVAAVQAALRRGKTQLGRTKWQV